jgi:hypothetical protein
MTTAERALWRVGCTNDQVCGWRGYRKLPPRRPLPCKHCGAGADKIEPLWKVGATGTPGQMKAYLIHLDWHGRRIDPEHVLLPGGQVVRFHANHYLGKALDVPRRLRQHRRGEGAAVVAWAVALGATPRLARVWDDPGYEGRHKQRSARPSPRTRNGKRRGVTMGQARYCPTCKQEKKEASGAYLDP